LEDAQLYRELGLAYRRDRTLSVASTAFIAQLRQLATQMKKGDFSAQA
jgi:DNA-binding transcriptional LysR family regulator